MMSIVAVCRSIIKPIVFSQDLLSKLADVPTPAGPTHPDDHSLPSIFDVQAFGRRASPVGSAGKRN